MSSQATKDFPLPSLAKSFFETRGRTTSVSARLYCNKLVYAFVRSTHKTPPKGWLHSRWHWYRYPFSMRGTVLWSPFLKAWFSPEDESAIECMLHLPDYEPLRWVQPVSGGVFIDIGAYIGAYAMLAARAVGPQGRVIAMEPDLANRAQLERNLVLNRIENCLVSPYAAWSNCGRVGWRKGNEPVWNAVDRNESNGAVEAVTVDEFVSQVGLDRVDWIKLDIEGGEVEALKGSAGTLAKFRPALFIEIHETASVLRALLKSCGYTIERELFDQKPERHGWMLARMQ